MTISRKRERPTLQYKLGDERLSTVESFTYLGVTISGDLRWREHVHNISAKATRVLNFVRRNIYHCISEVKALAYTSLIRPHLEYVSAAWDGILIPLVIHISLTKCRVGQHGSSKEITGRLHQFQNLSLS